MGTHRVPPAAGRPARLTAWKSWRGATATAAVIALALGSLAAVTAHRAPAVSSCATVGPGAVGPAVVTIQRTVHTKADGEYGAMTQAAVRGWQRSHGVPATGLVDASTWAALPRPVAWAACGQAVHGAGATTHCAQLHSGAVGPAVAVLQAAVGATVDGGFGPLTRAAVVHEQRSDQLSPTGVVGQATWAALHLTGTPACQVGTTSTAPDDAAQQAVQRQVLALARRLLSQPTPDARPIAAKAIVFARHQIGKPYQWGAEGPRAYDCSGLTSAAYLRAGITIPRLAADQYAGTRPVRLDLARPGDLLFYATDLTRPSTIHHVVMYLGHGRVIEAPQTGDVVKILPLWTDGLLPVAARPAALVRLPLRPGATGEAVAQLQRELDRHGAGLAVDAAYGPLTRAAARAWKRAHHRSGGPVFGLKAWLTLGTHARR
jgi:peptidoglycan hydrolase-like protein with peptidoglycan-binding domain